MHATDAAAQRRAVPVNRPVNRTVARGIVALSIAALAFEQSPANEAVRVNLGFRVLEQTGNALLVGLTVLAITLVIEGVPGALIAAGLHLNPSLERRLMRRDRRDAPTTPARRGGIGSTLTDVGIALGVGAGLVVVRRRWADPSRSLRDDLRTGAWACAIVAGVSGLIGFLLAGGIRYADAVGLQRPAELVVDYAVDWRFWFVVVALIQGGSWLNGRLRRRTGEPTPPVEQTACARADEDTHANAEATSATNDDAGRRPHRPRRDRPLRAAGRPGP